MYSQTDEDDDVCNSVEGGNSDRRCGTSDSQFRSIDGSCNNLANAHWGQANIALQRLLDPKYEDGGMMNLILMVFTLFKHFDFFFRQVFLSREARRPTQSCRCRPRETSARP